MRLEPVWHVDVESCIQLLKYKYNQDDVLIISIIRIIWNYSHIRSRL